MKIESTNVEAQHVTVHVTGAVITISVAPGDDYLVACNRHKGDAPTEVIPKRAPKG